MSKKHFLISMGGKLLKTVQQHAYLGIQIDHPLFWNPQVDYVCEKATRLLRFLKYNLRNCPRAPKELSYKHFILPTLFLQIPTKSLLWQNNTKRYIKTK